MKKYLIKKQNKYFTSFTNHYQKNGKVKILPIFGSVETALLFHSENDAKTTAQRVQGDVVEMHG